jgi:hypothetical protein
MNAQRIFTAAAVVVVLASAAWGEERTVPLQDVVVVSDGHGAARVFFRLAEFPFNDATVIDRAILRVPYAGAAVGRTIELRVCPVTEAWAGMPSFETPFEGPLGTLRRGPANGVGTRDDRPYGRAQGELGGRGVLGRLRASCEIRGTHRC